MSCIVPEDWTSNQYIQNTNDQKGARKRLISPVGLKVDTLGFGPSEELFVWVIWVDFDLIETRYGGDTRFEQLRRRFDAEV